jgi:S-adenosylmethionine decarboxylase
MEILGQHVTVDMYDCSFNLDNHEEIRDALVSAAKDAGATVVEVAFHKFNPYGVSGVIVIAESHLAIHTWPEKNFAAVDVFTCGDDVDPWCCVNLIREKLVPNRVVATRLHRGEFKG